MRVTIVLFLLIKMLVAPVAAHELWIEPDAYIVAPDTGITARLVNGQNFDGLVIRYFPEEFVRFTLTLGDTEMPVPGRVGDTPALNMAPLGEGLHIATYQSDGDLVNYTDYAVFERFSAHKDLATSLGQDVTARHTARGLPVSGFWEYYTRYSKALIGVGDGAGADRRMGLETELVALDNPFTDDLEGGMKVQLFGGDAPRAGAQIELFAKAPDKTVTISLHRTDADGIAVLPVQPGFSYLVDAVILREPEGIDGGDREVVWESLWAALTFAVPD